MRQSWRFAGVSAVYELDEEPQDDGPSKFMKSWWAGQNLNL
jgi:hypothetical protein